MTTLSRAARRVASEAFEGLVAAPFLVVLHASGWGGTAPLWLVGLMLALALASANEDLQRWLGGPDLTRHVHVRLLAQVGFATTLIYLLGWGPVLGPSLVMLLAHQLKWGVDAAVWRPLWGWCVVAITLGQVAIETGAVTNYVTSGAHAVAGLNILLLFLIMRLLGVNSAERSLAEDTVRNNEQRFRALVQNSTDVVLITDSSAVPIYVSPSSTRVTGRSPASLLGIDPYSLVHPDDREAMDEVLASVLGQPGAEGGLELRVRHPDGSWQWLDAVVRNLLHEPAVGGLVINYRDTTEQRLLADQLRHQAYHDPMTGLDNRALFTDRLTRAVARHGAAGPEPVLMLIDIDDFKAINDSLGHPAGDDLLVKIAANLRACVRPSDTVARLGGDEFAVLLEGTGSQHVEEWARRVLDAVQQDYDLLGRRLPVTASIGVTSGLPAGGGTEGLLRNADVAMYVAKANGKGRFAAYESGMEQAVHGRLQLKSDLSEALATGDQLALVFQPVVDLESGRAVGLEALVRWNHPTRGELAPAEFLGVAEETGMIVPIGRWVVQQACRQLAAWQRSGDGFADVWVSVNLSLAQICDDGLLHDLDTALRDTGIDPSHLLLEIRETALACDVTRTSGVIEAIRSRGIRVGIDDFGASSCALSYLRDFAVDLIKIDQSFITDAADDDALIIAIAIVERASRLAVPVVAQGIETRIDEEKLRAIGCAYGQGTAFAPPAEPAVAADSVNRLNARIVVPAPRPALASRDRLRLG